MLPYPAPTTREEKMKLVAQIKIGCFSFMAMPFWRSACTARLPKGSTGLTPISSFGLLRRMVSLFPGMNLSIPHSKSKSE